MYIAALFLLGADKWPEMKKKQNSRLELGLALRSWKMEVLLIGLFLDNYLLSIHYTNHKSN